MKMPPSATTPTNRLREIREAADESIVQLAAALDFKSTKQIERWETGADDIPTRHARRLAFRYGVSISYLLRDANGDKAA